MTRSSSTSPWTTAAVGATLNVGGTNVQSFTGRTVHTILRLRDGESNLLAGLLREQNATINTGFVGLVHVPILRNIFGNTNQTVDTSDVVIVVTPHIVRSHELTPDDLKPMFIGTQQNLGIGTPALISPETPIPSGVTPPGAAAPAGAAPAPEAAPRAPGVVPVEPASGRPAAAACAHCAVLAGNRIPVGRLHAVYGADYRLESPGGADDHAPGELQRDQRCARRPPCRACS